MFRVTAMSCPVPAGESRVSVFIPAQVSSCDVREALAKFWSKSTLGCMRRLFEAGMSAGNLHSGRSHSWVDEHLLASF